MSVLVDLSCWCARNKDANSWRWRERLYSNEFCFSPLVWHGFPLDEKLESLCGTAKGEHGLVSCGSLNFTKAALPAVTEQAVWFPQVENLCHEFFVTVCSGWKPKAVIPQCTVPKKKKKKKKEKMCVVGSFRVEWLFPLCMLASCLFSHQIACCLIFTKHMSDCVTGPERYEKLSQCSRVGCFKSGRDQTSDASFVNCVKKWFSS